MKTIFKIAFITLAAGSLFVSCKDKDEPTEAINLSLVSIDADAYFTDGSADVTATLSHALDKQVTVTLGPGYTTTAAKYAIIDAEDVSYPTIVIPAGATEAVAAVTVDTEGYSVGRYQAQVCIASVDGANVYESKSAVNISLINGQPLASIELENNSFGDYGSGTIIVSLQNALDEESTVTIEMFAMGHPSFTDMPEEAVEFEATVTIPADKDEVSVPVTVDMSKLTATGTYLAAFAISEVSGNLDFDDEDFTYGFLDFILPVPQEAWVADYEDIWTSTSSGDTFDEVYIDGIDAGKYYICARFPKGTYDNVAYISPVLSDVNLPGQNYTAAFFVSRVGYTVAELASYGLVNQGPGYWEFDHDDAGEYDVYVIALDAETGEFTGEYSVSTVEFADASLLLQWSGDWKLGEDTEISFIPYSLAYEEVLISGIEGASYVVADFDPETGDIAVAGQKVAKNVYLLPNIVSGGALDLAFVINNTISKISMTGKGEASASAEPVDDGTGTLFMGAGMSVYDLAAGETVSYIELPATLVKVVVTEPTAVAGKDGGKLTPRERKPVILKDTTPLTL